MSDDNKPDDLAQNPIIRNLAKSLMGLGNIVTELGKQVKEQRSESEKVLLAIEDIKKSGTKKSKVKDKTEDDDDDDSGELSDDDINSMSQADFLKLVAKETGKVVDKRVGEVSKTVESLHTSISRTNSEKDVSEFMKKHPDLLEWKDEIKELSKENPKLSIARLYNLVKAENPKKAKELATKYKDAKIEEDESGNLQVRLGSADNDSDSGDDEDDASVNKFFGLTPSGGGKTKEKNEKMNPKQAAEDAWNKTMAKLPASLRGDDT